MKITTQPIPLSSTSQPGEGTVVKRGALTVFRALRAAAQQARTVPVLFAQASADIHAAWEESAAPKP